jgi:hypothetical protein
VRERDAVRERAAGAGVGACGADGPAGGRRGGIGLDVRRIGGFAAFDVTEATEAGR